MRTDCNTCPVRDVHCGDCMVPVLLQFARPEPVLPAHRQPIDDALDGHEMTVLAMLRDEGLVTDAAIAEAVVSTAARGLRSAG